MERRWEGSTRWNEVGSVLLGGTKMGGFYLVERRWAGSTRWNEVGRVLLSERSWESSTK